MTDVPGFVGPGWYTEQRELAIASVACPLCGAEVGRRCKRWHKAEHRYHGSQKGVHNLRAILAVQMREHGVVRP